MLGILGLSQLFPTMYSCYVVLLPLESLFEGSSRGMHTLDGRSVLLYPGWSSPLSAQLWEGHMWRSDGGRGHLPSLPDQLNQLWRSME